MRAVARSRTVRCELERIWEVVSDPHHMPRWWPAVARVEDATALSWTAVLRSQRGRTVRIDFTRTRADPPRSIAWRQELELSPFERIFSSVVTEVDLSPLDGDETRVELRSVESLRGRYRLGAALVRRAARRRLDEALDGLERAVGAA